MSLAALVEPFPRNPTVLLEWATSHKVPVSSDVFRRFTHDSVTKTGLSDALKQGGVGHYQADGDRRTILTAIVHSLLSSVTCDRQLLVQLFMAREALGSTAIGDGIAIPHPLQPILLPRNSRIVRLYVLAKPIDIAAPDEQHVDTLFLIICSPASDHLQLLARLAAVLPDEAVRKRLRDRPAGHHAWPAPSQLVWRNRERIRSFDDLDHGIYFGGIVQIVSGFVEVRYDQQLGCTALTTYGFLWVGISTLGILESTTNFESHPYVEIPLIATFPCFSAVMIYLTGKKT